MCYVETLYVEYWRWLNARNFVINHPSVRISGSATWLPYRDIHPLSNFYTVFLKRAVRMILMSKANVYNRSPEMLPTCLLGNVTTTKSFVGLSSNTTLMILIQLSLCLKSSLSLNYGSNNHSWISCSRNHWVVHNAFARGNSPILFGEENQTWQMKIQLQSFCPFNRSKHFHFWNGRIIDLVFI